MQNRIKLLLIICIIFSHKCLAQAPTSEVWEGQLELGPEAILNIQFIIDTSEDGSQSVFIHSPDNGAIKNLAASSHEISGNSVHFEFSSLSGEFSGLIRDNRLVGAWSQLDSSFPLVMTQRDMSGFTEEQLALLEGTWLGEMDLVEGILELMVIFEIEEDGTLIGSYTDPAFEMEGVNAGGPPISDIEFKESILSFNIPLMNAHYEGQETDGGIDGMWTQGSFRKELNLRKSNTN